MNATFELEQAAAYLARGLAQDPALGLALSAAWLDPLHFCNRDYADDLYGNEEDPETLMRFAVNVARDCLPRLYTDMVQGLRQGWMFDRFDDEFCKTLKKLYPRLELAQLYDMIYGVPLDFCGLDPTDSDFVPNHPKLAAVLDRFFNVRPIERPSYLANEKRMEISEQDFNAAGNVSQLVIRSLIVQDRQPYADLALLLMYLFSETGNTLLDYTADQYWDYGCEPFPWDRQGLAMADEALLEAGIVLDAADRALDVLETEADIASALQDNIAAVQAALERKEKYVNLAWPARSRNRCRAKSYHRATGSDAGLLFVRDCYAKDG